MLSILLKDLLHHRKKFFLASFAIAWGTVSLILFLAFGEGLKKRLFDTFETIGRGNIIVFGISTSKPYKGLPVGRRIRFTFEDMEILRDRIPEIQYLSTLSSMGNRVISYSTSIANSQICGVDPAYQILGVQYPDGEGRFINDFDVEQRRRVICLGYELKNQLFGSNNALEKTVFVDGVPFLVVGVIQKKTIGSRSSSPDATNGYIPASTFSILYNQLFPQRFYLRPYNFDDANLIKEQIKRIFSSKYQFDPTDRSALFIQDFIEIENLSSKFFLGLQLFLGLIGSITLLLASVGVASMMYVIIRQNMREIGIKMCLGAKKYTILLSFLMEMLIIIFVGGMIGFPLSWLLIKVYTALPLEELSIGSIGTPIISWKIAILAIFILGFIGSIAGLFPAKKAASMNPVDALRYE